MRLFAAVLLGIAFALPAAARPLTPEEEAGLAKSMDSYLRAIGAGNAERIVKGIPPRIVSIFAGSQGIEAKNVEKTLIDQTAAMMKGSSFTDIAADRTALDAGDATLTDGTTVTWVVVPTAFTAETGGTKTRNAQPMLAVSEGGRWYFMRIDGEQQKQIVTIAYPFLSEVKFPTATVTPAP